jgi:hypothetical protein
MPRKRWLPMALCVAMSTGCFHQVVQTGRAPGNTIIDKPWVATWILGLVAAPEIDVRKECPSGAAVVTTEQSFMNGLVGVLTIGIFTPQHVTITCARSSASLPARSIELRIPTDASAAQSADIVSRAVGQAAETGSPVVLHF